MGEWEYRGNDVEEERRCESVLPGNAEKQLPTQKLLTVSERALDVERLRKDGNFSKKSSATEQKEYSIWQTLELDFMDFFSLGQLMDSSSLTLYKEIGLPWAAEAAGTMRLSLFLREMQASQEEYTDDMFFSFLSPGMHIL